MKKFLDKIATLATYITDDADSKDIQSLLHKTIKKVTEDIENFRFNTAISQLMILVNAITDAKKINVDTMEILSLLVAPFAPHLAEEIWCETLGKEFSVFTKGTWPAFDPVLVVDDVVTMAVQFAGKVRGTISVAPTASQDDVMTIIRNDSKLQKHLVSEPKKVIYVPGKIVNIIL